jgi:hypothetical protein
MKYKDMKKEISVLWEMVIAKGEVITALQNTIDKLSDCIQEQNKQLSQQDNYIVRKDEENNVLKRMYRDDIINRYIEK